MTIPSIDLDLSADDIGVGLTLKTKDGKTVTLDAFSVKDAEPERVRLDDLKIGDKLRLRCGRVLTVKNVFERSGCYDDYACCAADSSLRLYYLKDGRSNLHSKKDDVIEIIRVQPKCFSLKDAAVGDIIETLDGRAYTVEKIDDKDDMLFAKPNDGVLSLWFKRNGQCLGYPNENAIGLTKAPRVSIKDAKEGDTFVLRNGREYVCIEILNSFCRASHENEGPLWFHFDRFCPALNDSHDVIKLIPRSKPSLSEQISSQLHKIDGAIDRIVVSRADWLELNAGLTSEEVRWLNGVPIKWDEHVNKNEFSIVFSCS